MVRKDVIDLMLDQMRKIAHHFAGIHAFAIFYSFGTGTSAGFRCLLLERLLIHYRKKSQLDFTVCPARQASATLVEASSYTLATSVMVDHSESAVMVHYVALYGVPCETADVKHRLT
jgi:hypothetical protein